MYTVYVLESMSGRRYTGHTSDLDRRLTEHHQGRCKTTKAEPDWRIVYTEEYATRSEAMVRERWLKTGRGREFLTTMAAGWSPPRRSSSSGS
jgi:putative endonuclease